MCTGDRFIIYEWRIRKINESFWRWGTVLATSTDEAKSKIDSILAPYEREIIYRTINEFSAARTVFEKHRYESSVFGLKQKKGASKWTEK